MKEKGRDLSVLQSYQQPRSNKARGLRLSENMARNVAEERSDSGENEQEQVALRVSVSCSYTVTVHEEKLHATRSRAGRQRVNHTGELQSRTVNIIPLSSAHSSSSTRGRAVCLDSPQVVRYVLLDID